MTGRKNYRYTDIHNHILFGVDDGAYTKQISIEMLEDAAGQGVEAIIATPHYRHGMFAYPTERVWERWQELRGEAERRGIQLFLGCEYHVNSHMIDRFASKRCRTLAESEYILAEFSYDTQEAYIREQTRLLLNHAYVPVLAHVERYRCFQKHPDLARDFGNMGALIQINAGAVLGTEGRAGQKCSRKLLKQQWADIVASDSHNTADRRNRMGECFSFVCKKYSEEYAQALFVDNPGKIISYGQNTR